MPGRIRTRYETWHNNANRRTVKWTNVLLAQVMAGLCLAVAGLGFFVYVRDVHDRAQATQHETEVNEWRRCTDRAVSGAQIARVNAAAVDHAKQTATLAVSIGNTFDQIVAQFEQGPTTPRLDIIRKTVNALLIDIGNYDKGVMVYEAAAAAFKPQDPAKCPPKPDN